MTKLIIVSGSWQKQVVDFTNNCGLDHINLFVPKTSKYLVNLDILCDALPSVDALVLFQTPGLSHETKKNGDESELQRMERVAIECAHAQGKKVGVIGKAKNVLSGHLHNCLHGISVVGILDQERDVTGGLSDALPRGQIIKYEGTINDPRRFVQLLDEIEGSGCLW